MFQLKNLLRTSHNFHKNKSLVCFPPLFADFWYWEQDAHGSLRGSDVFPTVWQALLSKWVIFLCKERKGGGVIRCLFVYMQFSRLYMLLSCCKRKGFQLSSETYSLCYIVTLNDHEPTDKIKNLSSLKVEN